jgi:hypothetical protein
MKVRGSVYNGVATSGALPGLLSAAVSIIGPTGSSIGTATPSTMGEWSVDLAGNPGTAGDVRLSYIGKTRDLFVGERQLGFGPSWDINWPTTMAQVVSGTTTVRGGVSPEGSRLAVVSSGGGLTVTVSPGTVAVPGAEMWIASFYSAQILTFTGFNATTQAYESFGSGEPAGGWVVGVERIAATEQAYLTMARKESAVSDTLTTPNTTYTNALVSYDLNFIPLASVTRSGSLVTSVTQIARFLGAGHFHRRRREILTTGSAISVEIDTTGTTHSATSQTFAAGKNFTGRVVFRGDLKLEQTVATTWQLQATYGSTGTGNDNFDTPGQVAVDPSGNIYTVDTGNSRLIKRNSSGVYVSKISGMPSISGVCIDSSGNVYVLYVSAGFLLLNKLIAVTGSTWSQNLGAVTGGHLTTDSTMVWVVDVTNNRVMERLCSTGAQVTNWGSAGSGNGQFNSPYGIAYSSIDSLLYVVDQGNSRVQVFNTGGTYQRQWVCNSGWGIAPDTSGRPMVTQPTTSGQVTRFTTTGSIVDTFQSANVMTGIAVTTGDVVWVSNYLAGTIAKWDQVTSGSAGWENLRVLPDISVNGSWQSLNFGDATHGALGYSGGWGTTVIPSFIPFRGISGADVTIAAGDSIGARVVVKTTTGTARVSGGDFSFQLVDGGSW